MYVLILYGGDLKCLTPESMKPMRSYLEAQALTIHYDSSD
ncbi:hypothetical protein HMPREF0294_2007 [Corynebacterium glucuronolyticum ATCC 51867]|uniref:Uncharacterized protein n=1 Tax=Corynebacterium glucuronolyticum ATCC 51866 TaxID=548478 RepID=A0ABP2DUS0_9CORY|nr:hypothetical protein HMPREF0294_2007 [Corynebacterium glucuronolyticum ATCC 51867]EEI62949.1 hypothetical protein HMPREF0293_1467 [Corynebacterium glucuronolyticum ATCC 51866]